MARLGEHLVAAGLLSAEQVEQALRAQVLWGGRLGTNLIELHHLELDPLSKMLGRQHRMPAALARHFEKADTELQHRLSAEIAERFSCLPLLQMGPERHVVVAMVAPLSPRQLVLIADELCVDPRRLVPAIAAELRIRYQLERVYRIRRTARFLRAHGKSVLPFPRFPILPVQPEAELDTAAPSLPVSTREMAVFRPGTEPPEARSPAQRPPAAPPPDEDDEDDEDEDDDLISIEIVPPTAAGPPAAAAEGDLSQPVVLEDDLAILADPAELVEDEASARERRAYVRTLADAPASDPEGTLLGRIAIRRVAVGSAPRLMAGATLGEATRAIRRSTSRDRVGDLVVDTLERFAPACEAAILLVIRGATAIGWKGFQRAGGGLGELAVALEQGGLVPRAAELNVTLRRAFGELDPIDRLLLASLGQSDGDLVVVPISVADQVVCAIAIATAEDAPVACAEPIAAAAGAAFARLMRDASR